MLRRSAGWGSAGARMAARMAQTLPAAAQAGDVRLTGIVVAMPQRGPTGLRFVLEAESAATWPGNTPLHVPRQLQLAWFVPPGSGALAAHGAPAPAVWRGQPEWL